jgi:predicted dithiol-disulfide oxidoreductase (DUF899 family)
MDPKNALPAHDLARRSHLRFPRESAEYRAARTALLAEEIELRRHIERVAAHRRALPPGGEVRGDYQFDGADGPVDFAGLFGDHATLVVYSFMYGPDRDRPCPMCTSLLGPLDANARDLGERISLAVVARCPHERLAAFARERGWRHLPLFTDLTDAYSRDYHAVLPDGSELPALNVFTRRDGTVRHFWSAELAGTADPGQDARGAPDLSPLWNLLDLTPEGRGADWYPQLDYP